jgi:hypothetical protein
MNKIVIVAVLAILVLLGVFAWYFYGQEQEPVPVVSETAGLAVPPPVQPAQQPAPEPPAFQPVERKPVLDHTLAELPLPPLAESDEYVSQTLDEVVGEAAVMQYFSTEDLVARTVATIDALGSRQVPGNIQAMPGPAGSFPAVENPSPSEWVTNELGDPVPQYLSDPSGYRRYVTYVEMFEAVDTPTFIDLYERHYPLFQEAWKQLGYADGDFNTRLIDVIDELLATPDVEEPYELMKPEAVYLFVDEELEALSAGQKVLLRMGSENASRVKSKLSEIRQAL